MSSVQFNLLPDSKIEFNRTQRTKKLVYSGAIIASIASFALLIVMLGLVDGVQKKLMSDAAKNVDTANHQLQQLDVDKIITVQNQLQALPALHQKKHITSRIFTYLPKVTPPNVSINKLDLDLTNNTMTISGQATSQKDVNTFVDTLKFAKYKIGDSALAPAFSQVVESGFSLNSSGVSYTISMQVDPKLFQNGLTDSQGKAATPQISVDTSAFNSPLKDPSATLFNSSQTSTENK